jgi:hypothetical protein
MKMISQMSIIVNSKQISFDRNNVFPVMDDVIAKSRQHAARIGNPAPIPLFPVCCRPHAF